MNGSDTQTLNFNWQGIPLSVSYNPDWSGIASEACGYSIAHIEVRSLSTEDKMLPITETGYKSHFTSRELIESEGGPEEFVRKWLDMEALSPSWKLQQEQSKQLSLF